MVSKITFAGYKSFKEKQHLELRPITVLIGKNSSGKSAIAKLPTLIGNSLSGDFPEPVLPVNDGVELGSEFVDLVYGKNRLGRIEMELSDENERLSVVIASGTGSKDLPKVFSWKLTKGSEVIEVGSEGGVFRGFTRIGNTKASIDSLKFNVDYIGPFRELPKRFYERPRTSRRDKMGVKGENAYQFLIQDALTTEAVLLNKVSEWYQENFGGWGLQIDQNKAPAYLIEMTQGVGKLSINLVDVGQGMSQALPLVTRAFMPVLVETLIIIEQPELHLHPAAHGNLAELFASSTIADKDKKYLIETHSQNFILRLRRMIAEGILNKDDVVIYYIDFDEKSSTSNLKRIDIDDKGKVSSWPANVFSETLDETLAIRTAQLQ